MSQAIDVVIALLGLAATFCAVAGLAAVLSPSSDADEDSLDAE